MQRKPLHCFPKTIKWAHRRPAQLPAAYAKPLKDYS